MDEAIFNGLKSALEKGESMKRAMMTFYNSGYKKEEIEEAAQALTQYISKQPSKTQIPPQQTEQTPPSSKSSSEKTKSETPSPPKKKQSFFKEMFSFLKSSNSNGKQTSPTQKVSNYEEKQETSPTQKPIEETQKSSQKISSYEKKSPKEKKTILILIYSLGILIIILIFIFIFRRQVIDFFSSLLG